MRLEIRGNNDESIDSNILVMFDDNGTVLLDGPMPHAECKRIFDACSAATSGSFVLHAHPGITDADIDTEMMLMNIKACLPFLSPDAPIHKTLKQIQ